MDAQVKEVIEKIKTFDEKITQEQIDDLQSAVDDLTAKEEEEED